MCIFAELGKSTFGLRWLIQLSMINISSPLYTKFKCAYFVSFQFHKKRRQDWTIEFFFLIYTISASQNKWEMPVDLIKRTPLTVLACLPTETALIKGSRAVSSIALHFLVYFDSSWEYQSIFWKWFIVSLEISISYLAS